MVRNALCFLILGLMVIAICQAETNAQRNLCGPNEKYRRCGTACPPTCDEPGLSICSPHCVAGCECKKGYLRNRAGNCVARSDC